MAWRNAPRCPGRIQWKNLQLFDCRNMTNLDAVFKALCNHIAFSTNGGNIRPAITVFPKRHHDITMPDQVWIWNTQLLAYAGYEDENGNVIGDPINVKFTKVSNCPFPDLEKGF